MRDFRNGTRMRNVVKQGLRAPAGSPGERVAAAAAADLGPFGAVI